MIQDVSGHFYSGHSGHGVIGENQVERLIGHEVLLQTKLSTLRGHDIDPGLAKHALHSLYGTHVVVHQKQSRRLAPFRTAILLLVRGFLWGGLDKRKIYNES